MYIYICVCVCTEIQMWATYIGIQTRISHIGIHGWGEIQIKGGR